MPGPCRARRCARTPAEAAPQCHREGSGTSPGQTGVSRSPPCSGFAPALRAGPSAPFWDGVSGGKFSCIGHAGRSGRPASPARRHRSCMHAGPTPAAQPLARGLVEVRPWPTPLGTGAGEEGAGVQAVQRGHNCVRVPTALQTKPAQCRPLTPRTLVRNLGHGCPLWRIRVATWVRIRLGDISAPCPHPANHAIDSGHVV